jgi:hypothetical protein
MDFTTIKVTVSEEFDVPVGTKVVMSPNGQEVLGLQLTNGEFIKPWVKFELITDSNGKEVMKELDCNEELDRNVIVGMDSNRTIDGDLENASVLTIY